LGFGSFCGDVFTEPVLSLSFILEKVEHSGFWCSMLAQKAGAKIKRGGAILALTDLE